MNRFFYSIFTCQISPWILRWLIFTTVFSGISFAADQPAKPKLVVVLVIDQFRADYLMRFREKFLPPGTAKEKSGTGGFQYLLNHSAYYPLAQYSLLQNITAPGHATLISGSFPYQSGIPLQEWFDTKTQKRVYCTDDARYPIVESRPLPTSNKPSENNGASPLLMLGTTLGDELKNRFPESRVVSVSLKDRAAILLGGKRADMALWFDKSLNQWVSSLYYFPNRKLPEWVADLNPKTKQESPFTTSQRGITQTFSAAKQMIEKFQLGKQSSPDLLAISLSNHDVVGHTFGPNSPEIEQTTIEEDRAISDFFSFLNHKIPGGISKTLIVLTADHGVAPSPLWAKEHRIPSETLDEDELKLLISEHLNKKYGAPEKGNWILGYTSLNFFLNRVAITEKKLNAEEVEETVKALLISHPSVSHVVTRSDYSQRKLPPGMFQSQTLHTYFPNRSGDILIIPKPFQVAEGKNAGPYATSHHTSYSYDRTVPLLIAGPGIKPGRYAQSADITDLAPTMAFLLETLPPALSEGRVLSEIIQR